MAVYEGISKVNGIAIGNIGKITGITKADIWSLSGEQRQASLFRTLTNNNWGDYTPGKNSASFTAKGANGIRGEVYFQYDNHSSGDTYNFSFDKTGTTAIRIFELRISTASDLLNLSGGGITDVGPLSGANSFSITATTSNSTIYIGFLKSSTFSTDTLVIDNLIVTKS